MRANTASHCMRIRAGANRARGRRRPRQHARDGVTRRRDADADAPKRGDESRVNIAMGINDHDTFTGLAPLHDAARDGDLEKVIALLDDGADGNIRACGEVRPRARRAKSDGGRILRSNTGGGGGRDASRAAGEGEFDAMVDGWGLGIAARRGRRERDGREG